MFFCINFFEVGVSLYWVIVVLDFDICFVENILRCINVFMIWWSICLFMELLGSFLDILCMERVFFLGLVCVSMLGMLSIIVVLSVIVVVCLNSNGERIFILFCVVFV